MTIRLTMKLCYINVCLEVSDQVVRTNYTISLLNELNESYVKMRYMLALRFMDIQLDLDSMGCDNLIITLR